jgi:ABC-type sugar transport system substrate-binding protein
VFVLPHPDRAPAEIDVWEKALRIEARDGRSILEVAQPNLKDPHTKQAELIKDAINRGVAGLLVIPDHESAEALREAQEKGVAVIFIDRSVRTTGKPIPLMQFEKPHAPAESLVTYTLKAVKEFSLSEKGPALILRHNVQDANSDERAHALERALKKHNVDLLPIVPYSDQPQEMKATVEKVLREHPKLPMILIADEEILFTSAEVRNDLPIADRFAVAAFAPVTPNRKLLFGGQVAAIADLNHQRLARRALQKLWEAVEGKPLPEIIYVETPVERARENNNSLTIPVPKKISG